MTRRRPSVIARANATVATVETLNDGVLLVATRDDAADARGPEASDARSALTTATAIRVQSEALGNGVVRLRDPGGSHLAVVADENGKRWVFLDGVVFEVEIERGGRPRGRRTDGDNSLSAPMPATVIRVLVSAGDQVARGATLVLLEAMKMELPLKAPHDAVVQSVRCEAGQLVQPGQVLVELVAAVDTAAGPASEA